MPALAHSRSTLPHSLVARSTMAVTFSKFETSAPSAIAVPPALRISSTTTSAAVSDPPVPSRPPPKSLTTTLAPRLASPSACARPNPLPAPVTMATRPSNLIVMMAVPGTSSKIDQADPVRDQRRPDAALDFNDDVGPRLEHVGPAQFRLDQREPTAQARSGPHRRNEAQPVETVIHAANRARDFRQR